MKKIIQLTSLFSLVLLLSHLGQATENRDSFWLGTFSKKKLTDTYSYWIETQVRYGWDIGDTRQVLYRTGLLQNLEGDQGLGYLYGFIQSGNTREHRLTLQHTKKYGNFWKLGVSHRARLEGRFLEDIEDDAGRFRFLIRAEQNDFNNLGFVFYNEIFINTNKTSWNGDTSNDRNRLFLGFKKPFLETNKLEFGYLNQYVPRESGDISEHILFVGLSF